MDTESICRTGLVKRCVDSLDDAECDGRKWTCGDGRGAWDHGRGHDRGLMTGLCAAVDKDGHCIHQTERIQKRVFRNCLKDKNEHGAYSMYTLYTAYHM